MEAVLRAAFAQCDREACRLSDRQKQILLHALCQPLDEAGKTPVGAAGQSDNPLDRLTLAERQALLAFIQQQEAQQLSWKATLLNDWLQGQSSGPVQFIRQQYGIQWLDQVQPVHLARYAETESGSELKVGDRIEVTNGLWEWVQDDGPCPREWFACTVVSVRAAIDPSQVSCIVRFAEGAEYEIQSVYDWNRPNWRRP